MPLVQVKLMEEVLSDEQKREMIQRVTDAVVAVEGEGMRPYTWVIIEEVKGGQWGAAGQALTSADIKALRDQAAPVG